MWPALPEKKSDGHPEAGPVLALHPSPQPSSPAGHRPHSFPASWCPGSQWAVPCLPADLPLMATPHQRILKRLFIALTATVAIAP